MKFDWYVLLACEQLDSSDWMLQSAGSHTSMSKLHFMRKFNKYGVILAFWSLMLCGFTTLLLCILMLLVIAFMNKYASTKKFPFSCSHATSTFLFYTLQYCWPWEWAWPLYNEQRGVLYSFVPHNCTLFLMFPITSLILIFLLPNREYFLRLKWWQRSTEKSSLLI